MACPAVENEKALTARESGIQQREQLALLSHPRSSLDMELPGAASSVASFKSPAPAPASMGKIDKENLSLADKIRSPALDASYSKDQWRTIAIQAAARANGDVYEEWREPLPMTALDLQPVGLQKDMAGTSAALISQPSLRRSQADVCASGQSAAGGAQAHQPCKITAVSGNDSQPDESSSKQEEPLAAISHCQPVANLCTTPLSSGSTMSETAGSKQQPSQDENAVHDATLGSAHEPQADLESSAQPAAPLDEGRRAASCSSTAAEGMAEEAAEGMAAEPESASMPPTSAATESSSADMHVDSEADSTQPADSAPASQLDIQDSDVQLKVDSMSPVHRRQPSGQSSSGAQAAHRRQLSGESSKGSALSGNPYAGSCGGSRAGSMGGSPAGSLEPPEPIQTHLQHKLSGNPFAPPGTLRSRPVSPVLGPAPRHERSLSLQAPDLPVPMPAVLADYASSLSLPHPSRTALTGGQLYQMQQSPMPEEGETFRPAKDILQELFLGRVSRPQMAESTAALPDGTAGEAGTGAENADSSSLCGGQQRLAAEESETEQAAAEEPGQAADTSGSLPKQAQSWEPEWGSASSEGPPNAAISGNLPDSGARTGPQQQALGTSQNTWEAAWDGSLAQQVPDQAASAASAEPVQDPAWDPDRDASHASASSAPQQQDFTLLLPRREPPPPPAPAEASAQSVAQHDDSAAQREGALPVMRPEDRQKCERFYAQGFVDKGGVSASSAQPLHAKSGCKVPFKAIWQLVSPNDISASLDCSSFCLFMHLLKTSLKGIQLPASISPEQAREILGESMAAADSAADSQPAAQATTEAAGGSGEARAEKPRHTQGYSFFQPFQSGMQQGALTRRPSTADSPNRQLQARARPGLPPNLIRPASAASESSASHLSPGVSPCGALVAQAVREANREGTGQVWQPLASRQLDSWAHGPGPAHALSAPAPRLLAPKGQLRRQLTDIPSPRRVCPSLPSPRSSEGSPDAHAAGRAQRPSHASATGSERLTVTVNGAKVEYSKSLDRPFFSMSLHDASGKRLEPVQDTPPGHFDRRTFIITAGHDLQFKTPMRQIPPESVVYIEVKHWKSASKKMSTLGWSFAPIEMFIDTSSENTAARAGQLYLHLYKKPLSYTAHLKNGQLKQLHSKGHDLYLTLK